MIAHHFTVDVEEYFHPTALAPYFPAHTWDSLPRRSPHAMRRVVELLAERGVSVTCFVVGWLAKKEPEMVCDIVAAGHEIASHGWEHELVGRLGPDAFRRSVRCSKRALEDISGQEVSGFRAPSFSIVPGLEWALDILVEEGYTYDASLFPIRRHPTYGYPGAPRDPHWIDRPSGHLLEFPAATVSRLGLTLPSAGGAYFRLLPYAFTQSALRQAEARRAPGMFYIHPWELDLWRPDVDAPRLQRMRTFAGRKRLSRRMSRLLDEFSFRPIRDSAESMAAARAGSAWRVSDETRN